MPMILEPEEQIASVGQTLKRLQATRYFRGQAELVGDTRDHLEQLLHAHSRGELLPVPVSNVPSWPWIVIGLAVLAGMVLLLLQS